MSCDTSFELTIERVGSENGKKKFYQEVPEEILFTFKFKNEEGRSYSLFEYMLEKGNKLPYTTKLKGRIVTFNNKLKPDFSMMTLLSQEMEKKNYYVFQELGQNKLGSEKDESKEEVEVSGSFGNDSLSVETGQEEENSSEVLETVEYSAKAELERVLELKMDRKSIAPYVCAFSTNRSMTKGRLILHIESAHTDWEMMIRSPLLNAGKEEDLKATGEDLADGSQEEAATLGSLHSNPNWFSDMRLAFKESVVERCTKRTKDAVAQDEDIDNLVERRKVMNEILNQTTDYMAPIFGSDAPQKKHSSPVATLLGEVYPAMFHYNGAEEVVPSFVGYGLGGLKGLKGLPDRICNRYRDRHIRKDRRKKSLAGGSANDPSPKKPKNRAVVYGVSQAKWYEESNDKESLGQLKNVGQIEDFEGREIILKQNRPSLMKAIRNSKTMISKVCPGLFSDPGHIQSLFFYLTGAEIAQKIVEDLEGHLENMEEYLVSVNTSVEFTKQLDEIKDDCTLLFNGAKIHKYIEILRLAGNHFDSDGATFMRIEEDGNSKSSSPHIKAVRVGTSYVFELYVEQVRILEKMDLAGSISAFLHLVFVFNLRYPKESETVCDFLQRAVANYGNEEGSKTSKAASTAQSKLTKYYMQLGKILGAKMCKK